MQPCAARKVRPGITAPVAEIPRIAGCHSRASALVSVVVSMVAVWSDIDQLSVISAKSKSPTPPSPRAYDLQLTYYFTTYPGLSSLTVQVPPLSVTVPPAGPGACADDVDTSSSFTTPTPSAIQ